MMSEIGEPTLDEASKLQNNYLHPSIVKPSENIIKKILNKPMSTEAVAQLRKKYEDIAANIVPDKENKTKPTRRRGRLNKSKVRKVSDPLITNITELMSTSLNIISPEKCITSIKVDRLLDPKSDELSRNKKITKRLLDLADSDNDEISGDSNITIPLLCLKDPKVDISTDKNNIFVLDNPKNVETVELSSQQELIVSNKTFNLDPQLDQSIEEIQKVITKTKSKRKSKVKSSPKGTKFKERNGQGNLNGFIARTSPKNNVQVMVKAGDSDNEDFEGDKLKVSKGLFKSPKRSKNAIKRTEKLKEINDSKSSTKLTSVPNGDCEKSPKKVKFARKMEMISPDTLLMKILKSVENEIESNETEVIEIATNNTIDVTPETSDNEDVSYKPPTPKNDVFKFMMEQRNRSIGMNSTGRELEEETDSPKSKSKLSDRRKRLEEWNGTKGAIKRKLEEEARLEFVDNVLESRAKRLKSMLTAEVESDDSDILPIKRKKRKRILRLKSNSSSCDSVVESISPTAKKIRVELPDETCDGEDFNTATTSNGEDFSNHKTSTTSNGEDFSNQKTATTSKVQTGLLSFFGVINGDKSVKTIPNSPTKTKNPLKKGSKSENDLIKPNAKNVEVVLSENSNDSVTTKGGKRKSRKGRHSKLATKKTDADCSLVSLTSFKAAISAKLKKNAGSSDTIEAVTDIVAIETDVAKTTTIDVDLEVTNDEAILIDDNPNLRRRSTRAKIVQNYTELDGIDLKKGNKVDEKEVDGKNKKVRDKKRDEKRKKVEQTKKLAPLFVKSVPKPKEDPAVVEARKSFLYSGVPTSLKKTVEKQKSVESNYEFEIFPTISHIRQKPDNCSPFWNLPSPNLQLLLPSDSTLISIQGDLKFGLVTQSKASPAAIIKLNPVEKGPVAIEHIKAIKALNPDFPVYKCFRQLREKGGFRFKNIEKPLPAPVKPKKRGRPRKKPLLDESVEIVDCESSNISSSQQAEINAAENAMWTEKYKPKCADDIIGNNKNVSRLKSWLQDWIEFSDERKHAKRRVRSGSSDFESTSGESKDSARLPTNTMILTGPSGSGKTSSVYAICHELGINVLELNASSKRTGKRLLQELQEATQSHQVRKKESNLLTGFLQNKLTPKSATPDNKMCLLLVEDVDIVFDQDEAFIHALGQLLLTSKRPVILIATNIETPHLQKFVLQYHVLEYSAMSAKTLATWLQILCLLEGLSVKKSSVGELLEWNQGDIRRCLLQLQFWAQSGGDAIRPKHDVSVYESMNTVDDLFEGYEFVDEELSSLHLEESDVTSSTHENCVQSFVRKVDSRLLPYPVNLGSIWWNVPNLLSIPPVHHCEIAAQSQDMFDDTTLDDLEKVHGVFDALSYADFLGRSSEVQLEPTVQRWQEGLKDGMSLKECLSDYKSDRLVTNDLTHFLIEGRCKIFKTDTTFPYNTAVPNTRERKWRFKQHECESAYIGILPTTTYTDRTAFSVDYYPILRAITRSETERASNSGKRGNRFYNYLRTLNVDVSATVMNVARDVLRPK